MRIVVMMSGGLDSSTLAAKLKSEGHEIVGLFVNYGQKTAEKEMTSVRRISRHLGIKWTDVEIKRFPLIAKSALLDTAPLEHTEVPGRNAILLSLGVAFAESLGYDAVAYGAHSVDTEYPDCQPAFVHEINEATMYAYKVKVIAPFLMVTKKEIVEIAKKLQVPVDDTYSCYYNPCEPCGECPACLKRKAALEGS